jgi:hypothetical protein
METKGTVQQISSLQHTFLLTFISAITCIHFILNGAPKCLHDGPCPETKKAMMHLFARVTIETLAYFI